MNKPTIFVLMMIALASCQTTSVVDTGTKKPAVVDFGTGEVLVGANNGIYVFDNTFYLAKIIAPATEKTQNMQVAEFVKDATQKTVDYVIISHKARASEIVMGMNILQPGDNDDPITSREDYRKEAWYVGTVTSIDRLDESIVEINWDNANLENLRIIDSPEIK